MLSGLFHKDVFAPVRLFQSPGRVSLRYSTHALKAAVEDRYGDLTSYLPDYIDFDTAEIVEVEVCNGRIVKRVVRVAVTADLALVLAVQSDGLVRTVWANLHSDTHATLHKGKFVKPQRLAWNALVDLH